MLWRLHGKLEFGNWSLEIGIWKMEFGSWSLEIGIGYCELVIAN
jgi:hypothetical protein